MSKKKGITKEAKSWLWLLFKVTLTFFTILLLPILISSEFKNSSDIFELNLNRILIYSLALSLSIFVNIPQKLYVNISKAIVVGFKPKDLTLDSFKEYSKFISALHGFYPREVTQFWLDALGSIEASLKKDENDLSGKLEHWDIDRWQKDFVQIAEGISKIVEFIINRFQPVDKVCEIGEVNCNLMLMFEAEKYSEESVKKLIKMVSDSEEEPYYLFPGVDGFTNDRIALHSYLFIAGDSKRYPGVQYKPFFLKVPQPKNDRSIRGAPRVFAKSLHFFERWAKKTARDEDDKRTLYDYVSNVESIQTNEFGKWFNLNGLEKFQKHLLERDIPIKSFISIPIIYGDVPIGVLNLDSNVENFLINENVKQLVLNAVFASMNILPLFVHIGKTILDRNLEKDVN